MRGSQIDTASVFQLQEFQHSLCHFSMESLQNLDTERNTAFDCGVLKLKSGLFCFLLA